LRGGKRGLRMGLFDFLKKRNAAEAAEKPDKDEELERYTGLRAEVTSSDDGRLLFIAKLLGVRGGRAELHQQSGGDIDPETEALHVKIRGYSEKDKKAVYLQGMISPGRTGSHGQDAGQGRKLRAGEHQRRGRVRKHRGGV